MKQTFGAIAFCGRPGVSRGDRIDAGSRGVEQRSERVERRGSKLRREHNRRERAPPPRAWRYRVARPWPHRKPYSYGDRHRPRPIFYRPFLAPAPLFSVGFGRRYHWKFWMAMEKRTRLALARPLALCGDRFGAA